MRPLHPCPRCERHHAERACPFCGRALSSAELLVPLLALATMTGCPVRAVYAGPPPDPIRLEPEGGDQVDEGVRKERQLPPNETAPSETPPAEASPESSVAVPEGVDEF